jgi:hypothetical protein
VVKEPVDGRGGQGFGHDHVEPGWVDVAGHGDGAAQSSANPGWAPIPEACAPISPIGDASVAEQVARIRDLPATALTRELEAGDIGDRHWPAHWRVAGDQPRRWPPCCGPCASHWPSAT